MADNVIEDWDTMKGRILASLERAQACLQGTDTNHRDMYRLCQENAKLRQENASLRTEVAWLQMQLNIRPLSHR